MTLIQTSTLKIFLVVTIQDTLALITLGIRDHIIQADQDLVQVILDILVPDTLDQDTPGPAILALVTLPVDDKSSVLHKMGLAETSAA